MRINNHFLGIMSGACLAVFPACKSNVPEAQSSTASYSEQGLGDMERLTQAERALYQADQDYLQKLTPPDTRIRLNLADPQQYRFMMARLKLAGKTPMNSPHLFEAMAQRRQTHLARGYRQGILPQEEMKAQVVAGRREIHRISVATAGETTAQTNNGLSVATSTFPGGSDYTYVDTSFTDSSGYSLGSLGWSEEYSGGQNVATRMNADLSRTRLRQYKLSSYKIEDSAAGFTDSYMYTQFGTMDENNKPGLNLDRLDAPIDLKFNDGIISICLNRTWTQDCDYDLTGEPQAIKLPLKGVVRLTTDHVFDTRTIREIREDLAQGRARADAGFAELVLTNVGGGCDVVDNNRLNPGMAQFWKYTAVSADGKSFSWDLTGANAMFFDNGCRQVQDRAALTVQIRLPILSTTTASLYSAAVTLSNNPLTQQPTATLKPMTFTNSCLAAGTRIETAPGATATIESLKMGDHVSNPYRASLTVTDTAIGSETSPMVRIRDEADRTLLMTEMHPIQVVARGMVQAKALRQGDVVMTRTGPSKLVAVSREAYTGKVYNLKVGADAEKLALGEDQTAVYANGFLVGDGQIQSKYESLAMKRQDGDVLARLPSKWHRDYQLSTQRR